MIPISRLEKIPRRQRLHKLQKIFAEAERNLINNGNRVGDHNRTNIDYAAYALFLASDEDFSDYARRELGAAAAILKGSPICQQTEQTAEERRAFNTVRHILLAETGRLPSDWDFINPDGKLDSSLRRVFPGMFVYLEDIRSPYNVGSIFRSAESFGVQRLYLSPLCADPNHPRAKRTAMGCVEIMEWQRICLAENEVPSSEAVPSSKAVPSSEAVPGPYFALETGGLALREFKFPKKGIMILGNEELGVSPALLELADASLGRVSIPNYGVKASLNASAAFAIAVQAWTESLVI